MKLCLHPQRLVTQVSFSFIFVTGVQLTVFVDREEVLVGRAVEPVFIENLLNVWLCLIMIHHGAVWCYPRFTGKKLRLNV